MSTQVVRIKLINDGVSLDKAIETECSIRAAVGYRLASSFVEGEDLVLIFQK